jgi:hypothetical protein
LRLGISSFITEKIIACRLQHCIILAYFYAKTFFSGAAFRIAMAENGRIPIPLGSLTEIFSEQETKWILIGLDYVYDRECFFPPLFGL